MSSRHSTLPLCQCGCGVKVKRRAYRYASAACFWRVAKAGGERDYFAARADTRRQRAAREASRRFRTKRDAYKAGCKVGYLRCWRFWQRKVRKLEAQLAAARRSNEHAA